MLAGFPGKGGPDDCRILHAGGLQHCIEKVEELAILEHDRSLQARKEGLFVLSPTGYAEQIADLVPHLSDRLIQDGITDNWLNDNTCLGNGVCCLKSSGDYLTKEVNHACGRTREEIFLSEGTLDYSRLRMHQVHDFTEGWGRYERRWRAGTCPQYSHLVHITTMLVKHELPAFAYRRILDLVENAAQPIHPEQYSSEQGKHFSNIRRWNGKPAHRRVNALPQYPSGI